MGHGVAVRTYWTKISNWIYFSRTLCLRDGVQVVNVDKTFANLAEHLREIETTNTTTLAVVVDTLLTCYRISLNTTDKYCHSISFDQALTGHLIRHCQHSTCQTLSKLVHKLDQSRQIVADRFAIFQMCVGCLYSYCE